MSDPVYKFTLRFRNPKSRDILGILAERFGVSRNQLAEEMLERELHATALVLAHDLTGTLELLQRYHPEHHLQAAIAAFADAEGTEVDPMATRMAESFTGRFVADQFGIAKAFT